MIYFRLFDFMNIIFHLHQLWQRLSAACEIGWIVVAYVDTFRKCLAKMLCESMLVIGMFHVVSCFMLPNVEIPSLRHDRNWSQRKSSEVSCEVSCEVSYGFTIFTRFFFFNFVVSCDLSVEVNEWCKEMGAAAWPSCVTGVMQHESSHHFSIIFHRFFRLRRTSWTSSKMWRRMGRMAARDFFSMRWLQFGRPCRHHIWVERLHVASGYCGTFGQLADPDWANEPLGRKAGE